MEKDNNIVVSISPHICSTDTVQLMMLDVIISLVPAIVMSIVFYGILSVRLIICCVIGCVLSEFVAQKIMRRETTIFDLSTVVTGILLAFCLPPGLSPFIAISGSIFSIVLGKQIFGGLGYNPFNPALIGRAFLQVSWPNDMNIFINPIDGLTAATPLTITKLNLSSFIPTNFDLFIGNCAGCLGETSKLALLLGAVYLLFHKRIKLYIPLSYIISVILVTLIFGKNILFHTLSGGIILGAFFMATDPVSSPMSNKGKIIFGLGCGFLTMLIRLKGGFPEGVCYSILIMNMLTPVIDKYTKVKKFGV